jgi:hypothetical protein
MIDGIGRDIAAPAVSPMRRKRPFIEVGPAN